MLTDISAVAGYKAAKPAVAPVAGAGAGIIKPMPSQAATAGDRFQVMLDQVDQVATKAMTGQADTHLLVQRIAEAELALQTVVSVRDKVVEAYQDLLRMPL